MPDLEDQALELDPPGIPMPSLQTISWSLIAGGGLSVLTNLLTGRRRLMDWIVPVSLLGLGAGVLLQQRQTRLEASQKTIIAELDATPAAFGFDVSPDRRWVLYQGTQTEADIMLVENFR